MSIKFKISVDLIEQCDIQEILQKIRANGVKPSKSLVKLHGCLD